MKKSAIAIAMALMMTPSLAGAQQTVNARSSTEQTRLDLSVTGTTTRVPDIAVISAGVVTRAATASAALAENAERMDRVLKALKNAGIAERDMQTASINLNPQYDYRNGEEPRLIGYQASNQLTVKFRDIAQSGAILDVLVAQGANQINGPNLTLDKPDEALDEARIDAVTKGRERAELYAKALGMRVARLVMINESGRDIVRPMPMLARLESADFAAAPTAIVAGEQDISVTVEMSFDLE